MVAIESVDATTRMSADLTSMSNEKNITDDAIRYGTFASLLFSIVAFATNLLLPVLLGVSGKHGLFAAKTSSTRRSSGIPQAWTCAHVFFALAMFATWTVTSQVAATLLVASVGLSWALTHWAPFAIIGNELGKDVTARNRSFSPSASAHDFPDDVESSNLNNNRHHQEVQAGAVMGLHNVAVSAPQMVAALLCSVIFALAKVVGSKDGTGWVLRAGGCAALFAAYLTSRFDE